MRLRSLTDEQGHAAALADKDNLPFTAVDLARLETVPDTRAIRENLGLTQREFAGRFQPDQAARTLLRLIAREPELVERAGLYGVSDWNSLFHAIVRRFLGDDDVMHMAFFQPCHAHAQEFGVLL